MMESGLEVQRLSAIYETEPVENSAQALFLNMIAELRGDRLPTPEQVMARLLRVEFSLGRTREVPKGPRTLDLDLLLFKNESRDTEFLTLPHPRIQYRRFVLVPLAELVPNLIHPTLNETVANLLAQTEDCPAVRKWP